jgi:hypothetical protein
VQVDKEVRIGELIVENLKESHKQPVLLIRQIFAGKDKRLPKAIICNHKRVEQRPVVQTMLKLFVPLGHKKQLDRKAIPLRVVVKEFEKGIVCKFFEDELTIIVTAELFAQGCFAGADIAFDADILVWKGIFQPPGKIATSL